VARRAAIRSAEQRQRREGQLRDALERKNEIDVQMISVDRQLGSLSGQSLRTSPYASLSAVIRRAGATGAIEIVAEPSTLLQPGDIVVVALEVTLSEQLVSPDRAALVVGSAKPRKVTP
jgi:Trk K+ transport system NAD-binding subunit